MVSATTYETRGGIRVTRTIEEIPVANAIDPLIHGLDAHRGMLLASSYEYPGRYTRWDIGFVDPPLALTGRGRTFRIEALNPRGQVLLAPIAEKLDALDVVEHVAGSGTSVEGLVSTSAGRFAEEERSRQPSLFSVLHELVALFHHPDEPHLGLYGAFGYDLAFQFEPIRLRLPRPSDQRDLVLYLPDELVIVDHRREVATRRSYDFVVANHSTDGLARVGRAEPYMCPARVITNVASTRPWSAWRRRRSSEAISSRSFRARRLSKPARHRRPRSSFASVSGIHRHTGSS